MLPPVQRHSDGSDSIGMPETPLARLVDAALIKSGETLESVSRRSGIPVSSLNAYRRGQITGERTSPARLEQLALALGLNMENLAEAVGVAMTKSDEMTMMKLFRRLPSNADKAQAVETLRVHVKYARARRRP